MYNNSTNNILKDPKIKKVYSGSSGYSTRTTLDSTTDVGDEEIVAFEYSAKGTSQSISAAGHQIYQVKIPHKVFSYNASKSDSKNISISTDGIYYLYAQLFPEALYSSSGQDVFYFYFNSSRSTWGKCNPSVANYNDRTVVGMVLSIELDMGDTVGIGLKVYKGAKLSYASRLTYLSGILLRET